MSIPYRTPSLPDPVVERITLIYTVLHRWLSKNEQGEWAHEGLNQAIQQTVQSGHFSASEVDYQLQAIRSQLTDSVLFDWTGRVWTEVEDVHKHQILTDSKHRTVLCLHAGNLPLSGFQDLVVVMISGYRYRGKLSRQDPWLLASLIQEFERAGFSIDGYSDQLDVLPVIPKPDYVFFSGSEQTTTLLQGLLESAGQLHPEHKTSLLVRYASGSVAVLQKKDLESTYVDRKDLGNDGLNHQNTLLSHLIHAAVQYSGRGCRSVSTVLSDVPLEEVIPALTRVAEEHGYSHGQPTPDVRYDAAYGAARGRSQVLIGSVLFREEPGWASRPGLVNWIQMDAQEYLEQYASYFQSVYVADERMHSSEFLFDSKDTSPTKTELVEPLSAAQNPPLDWKPDGIDALKWLWDPL